MPRVSIDFGDGRRLERTLQGNVAFWFTTADGGAFDLLPGLPTRAVLFERCHQALDLHRRLVAAQAAGGDDAILANLVIAAHARPRPLGPLVVLGTAPAHPDFATNRVEWLGTDQPAVLTVEPAPDLRKFRVESPIKTQLGIAHAEDFGSEPSATGAADPTADLRKSRVESPIKSELGIAHADADHDRQVRYPKAHALLARAPLANVDTLTHEVYASILGVDLRDPYLGLAPWVLGGELGRSEPKQDLGTATDTGH